MTTINNLPATCKTWIVARYVEGAWWFWGCWDEKYIAAGNALMIDGEIFHRDLVER